MSIIPSRIAASGVAALALALQGCMSVPVNLRSEPAGATVLANGKAIGTTPMRIDPDRFFPQERKGLGWYRDGTLTLERPGCTPKSLAVDNDTLKRSLTVELECRPDAPVLITPNAAPYQTSTATRSTEAPTGGGTAERLKELDGLRRQGLITTEEYQSIRRRILDQL
jgi:hypothetical protein